jgi:DNA-binding GntR family transcriptional regulator
LEKIEKAKSFDEQAYLHIKDAIVKGLLRPGEFVAEVRLAEELGISKTPVRKAVARLRDQGFLVAVPYKGHFVSDISVEDISEVYELRQLLECHLVRNTVEQFTATDLEAMGATLKAADDALKHEDVDQYVMHNREFHHYFDRKYGHQRISDVLDNLDEHVQRIILYARQSDYYYLIEHQQDEHRQILEATRRKDVELAVRLMRSHLSNFCDALVEHMKDRVPAS